MNKNNILKSLLLIAVIIVFCTVLTRIFSGSETLTEYAEKNPQIAYQEKERSESSMNSISSDKNISSVSHNISAEKNSTADGSDMESINNQENEDISMVKNSDRITYKENFYYEPLSDDIIQRITGVSYPVTADKKDTVSVTAVNIANSLDEIQVSYDDLRYVSVLYYNFKGIERYGELICNKAIAQDIVEIFYELYQNEYQIEQIRLIDEYSGDDTLSMLDNNTSCFNYRVVDGTSSLSKHALGLAIDINPFYNPYVVFKNDGTTYISPQGSETYADRSKDFAYKIDENDLCYKLFKEHGFIWGGDWNSCKDYQHFQKVPE